MKNLKRNLTVGLVVGALFFGWYLYAFFMQNWYFNIFSVKDWAYLAYEFKNGWVISTRSDWIFVFVVVISVPVFLYLWSLALKVQWRQQFSVWYKKALFQLRGGEKGVKRGKIKLKAVVPHTRLRPRPITMGMHTASGGRQAPAHEPAAAPAHPPQTPAPPAAPPQNAFDADLANTPLDEIQLPTRVKVEEDIAALFHRANYTFQTNLALKDKTFDFVAVAKGSVLLCVMDNQPGDWLADEESFNNEDPLWFSENSHRTSPVFDLIKSAQELTKAMEDMRSKYVVTPVLIVNKGNIINGADMLDVWQKLGVVVCRTDVGGPDELPVLAAGIPMGEKLVQTGDLTVIQSYFKG